MPPYSWAVPGINPGTSTKVSIGMLKQSQNLTNLAPLIEELTSKAPAITDGWLANIPVVFPLKRAKPTIRFFAKCSCTSKK